MVEAEFQSRATSTPGISMGRKNGPLICVWGIDRHGTGYIVIHSFYSGTIHGLPTWEGPSSCRWIEHILQNIYTEHLLYGPGVCESCTFMNLNVFHIKIPQFIHRNYPTLTAHVFPPSCIAWCFIGTAPSLSLAVDINHRTAVLCTQPHVVLPPAVTTATTDVAATTAVVVAVVLSEGRSKSRTV